MSDFGSYFRRVADGETLAPDDMTAAFSFLLQGDVDPIQAGAFLTALKVRGETSEEIAAAAKAMRAAAIGFDGPDGAIDTCGTGGDGADTVNISTATALVLSACGVPVAKHGNRAVSSASGSSDVLSALGVNILIGPERAEHCLRALGIAFLFAPHHHPAVAHVAPIRTSIGVRTLFNLLGPLCNPANAKRQLLGVYDQRLCRPLAQTLATLGSQMAWVVHGADGIDELTISGPTHVAELNAGTITEFSISPEDAGLERSPIESLKGGGPDENADALRALLAGKAGAYRDTVILNTAAGLIIAGQAADLKVAAARAAAVIDSGAAQAKLSALIQWTNDTP